MVYKITNKDVVEIARNILATKGEIIKTMSQYQNELRIRVRELEWKLLWDAERVIWNRDGAAKTDEQLEDGLCWKLCWKSPPYILLDYVLDESEVDYEEDYVEDQEDLPEDH